MLWVCVYRRWKLPAMWCIYGEYAAVEIKLGYNKVEEAKTNLLKFYDNMIKKPKFMCIIVGKLQSVIKDPKTGIYIVPITALKP